MHQPKSYVQIGNLGLQHKSIYEEAVYSDIQRKDFNANPNVRHSWQFKVCIQRTMRNFYVLMPKIWPKREFSAITPISPAHKKDFRANHKVRCSRHKSYTSDMLMRKFYETRAPFSANSSLPHPALGFAHNSDSSSLTIKFYASMRVNTYLLVFPCLSEIDVPMIIFKVIYVYVGFFRYFKAWRLSSDSSKPSHAWKMFSCEHLILFIW